MMRGRKIHSALFGNERNGKMCTGRNQSKEGNQTIETAVFFFGFFGFLASKEVQV